MSVNRIFPLLILLAGLLFPADLFGQVPVEVSKQKIVVEGKIYYMHQVLKGQTIYSISKAYNVPEEIIIKENKIVDNSIKEGQMLKIPSSAQLPPHPENENKAQTQVNQATVKPAESKPQTQTQTQTQPQSQTAQQDEQYIYHRVTRGETLASIAYQFNVSVRDLKKANKGLLFPEEGEYLKIPKKKSEGERPESEKLPRQPERALYQGIPLKADTIPTQEVADTFIFSKERTAVKDLKGTVRVAVMLPFFLYENNMRSYTDSTRTDNKGKKIYKEVDLPGEWLYEGSVPFVEMYEGILVAVDSLRTLGLKIDMSVYDTGTDTSRVKYLISSGRLKEADLIIGPVYSANLRKVADFAAENDIPVVSPVPLRDQTILENRPTLFRICPSLNVYQDIMITEVNANPSSNVIFVYSDSLMIDPQTELFWKKLTETTTSRQQDSTLIAPFYYSTVALKGNLSSGVIAFDNMMKVDHQNIIILATSETPVVSSVFSTLHALAKKYQIRVMGYPEISSLPTIDLRYYYDMGLLIPSESYVDYSRYSTTRFIRSYFKRFNTEPAQDSFAWRGFDIAYYFIGGVATEGKGFIKHPWKFTPQLISHDLRFSRSDQHNGFDNKGLYVIRYNKDMTVTVTPPGLENNHRP